MALLHLHALLVFLTFIIIDGARPSTLPHLCIFARNLKLPAIFLYHLSDLSRAFMF